MSESLAGILYGILGGAIAVGAVALYVALSLGRRFAGARARPVVPAIEGGAGEGASDAPSGPVEDAPEAAAETGPAVEPARASIAALGRRLGPLAEDVAHPDDLGDLQEFRAVVEAMSAPDIALETLGQYARGANWPLACAALVAMIARPDRQALRDSILRHLRNMRPYVLPFAFRYLNSLDERAPPGAALLAAEPWWEENSVIPGFFEEYFERCAVLGDPPELGSLPDADVGVERVEAWRSLLARIRHPFASAMRAELDRWLETRIDLGFLATVGTVWTPQSSDPLLVVPDSWREPLARARSAILLARPRSVLVTGEPQVGKTAFVRLLADALRDDGWIAFAAGSNELMADQMYVGQLEGRIRKILDALHARRKVLWYMHDVVQASISGKHMGQPASILDQILPGIASGALVVVGEADRTGAARLLQRRPSLRPLIEVVSLPSMGTVETADLAERVGTRIEQRGGPSVPPQAIATAMQLARHYLDDNQFPGAVLELVKRAASRAVARDEKTVTSEGTVATLSEVSGLPAVVLDSGQRADLGAIRAFFERRVMGQPEAVGAMVDRIAMLKAGLVEPGRPIGVFLFAGPTGTGKTELAKTLAEFLFGSGDRMTRLDMSEFQTPDSLPKILGDRGNPDMESLVDRIRRQPFSVVLLDEFEKAHHNVWDLFLQIFDDGRLTDARGNVADFRHCIVILTSNLGATAHRDAGLGFRRGGDAFVAEQVMRTIAQTFRPEFVNRLDKVIVFRPLTRDLMRGILHKELARVLERRGLRERAWAVEWEASAIEFLLDQGFSAELGARPLKRAIDQKLLAPLAATMVEHRFPEGDQFLFVRANGKSIDVEFVDPDAEPEGEPVQEADQDDALSLPAIVLRQTGTAAERAVLDAVWQEARQELDGDAWRSRVAALREELADAAIWTRDDRHRVFSKLELVDRIDEAASTAERLFARYRAASDAGGRASRELASRIALQLYNLRNGTEDFVGDAPVDALLRVDPTLEAGAEADATAWCRRLTEMYRSWAAKRRMRIEVLTSHEGRAAPILLVTGFGAFRTLALESGLHILEEEQGEEASKRTVARVSVVAGPERELPAANAYAAAARSLAAAPAAGIVRRYRRPPGQLVRDSVGGWRSGRLDAVLGGDFDLIGAIKKRQAAVA